MRTYQHQNQHISRFRDELGLGVRRERQAGSGRKDAQALHAAIRGGDDLHAQASGFEPHDFAGQRNAAFDLADQAAERGGFVGFAQTAQAGSPKRSDN